MGKQAIQREWVPYRTAAREYIGISDDGLRAAINAHELPAYEKPLTRGRKKGATRENHSYYVSLEDVNKWIRTHWPQPERV